ASGFPHSMQNFLPEGFSVPHSEQISVASPMTGTPLDPAKIIAAVGAGTDRKNRRCEVSWQVVVGCSQNSLTCENATLVQECPQVKRGSTHSKSEALIGLNRPRSG